jgi:diacylglycerol kinase family enzyme
MAGDSGVSRVINVMIELIAYQDFFGTFELDDIRAKLKTPLCILPVGTTNMIANSIYGPGNIHNSLMHLFYGNTIRIDVSAAFKSLNHKLHSFSFGYSCGFGTTLARYMRRYQRLGLNKFQTSIAKGISKKKHRLIFFKSNMIPSFHSSNPI